MKNNPSIFAIFAGVFIVLVMVVVLQADEWNDKPVLCGTEEEIMPLLANKEEVRYLQATQITTVKEEDGISSSPVLLPIAIYTNPISKSYTILEYHPSYKSYCIISVGLDLE